MMRRRDFLATSLAASTVSGAAPGESRAEELRPEYYVLTKFLLRRGPKVRLAEDYFREALLPALKRAGIGPVGVFSTMVGPESPAFYLLISYPTFESIEAIRTRLEQDADYVRAHAPFADAPSSDPSYVRFENSLLIAFEGMPRLEVPPAALARRTRIYELRVYESHSLKAHLKKVEMFNRGEIAIFRRTGLRPVFFGRALVGARLPHLTYLLAFADLAERERNWATFANDPEWKKLSTTPGYTDGEIVSNISNAILGPAPYSEV